MTSQTPASTSDARKRKAERDTDQPPTLPDISGWVKREPGDVIEAGTPYVCRTRPTGRLVFHPAASLDFTDPFPSLSGTSYWTPPPAPAPVWSVISTDREKPTLAWVRLGHRVQPVLRQWYRTDDLLFSPNTHGRFDSQATCQLVQVSSVELLHTHSPETHVPVERALVERLLGGVSADFARAQVDLAALADGATS